MSTHPRTGSTSAVDLANRWTKMWNGEVPAHDVVAADCVVHFGRTQRINTLTTTTTPAELQRFVDVIREAVPGITYSHPSMPLYQADQADLEAGAITLLWNVMAPSMTRTGIDIIRHRGDRIVGVWSITGDFELPPME